MKTLVIPDIHDRIHTVDPIIKIENPDEVVFLGDYFDSMEEDETNVTKTARWLKARLYLPGYHFLMGNHEAQYRWPNCPWHVTNCYSGDKQKAIDNVLTKKDWQQMHLAVERGNWWFTHAGLHPRLFIHPILGFSTNRTWEKLHHAELLCEAGIHTPITDLGRYEATSGPLWLRWDKFTAIDDVNQVVGHTSNELPQKIEGTNSENWNIDTHSEHYAVLQNGKLTVKKRTP